MNLKTPGRPMVGRWIQRILTEDSQHKASAIILKDSTVTEVRKIFDTMMDCSDAQLKEEKNWVKTSWIPVLVSIGVKDVKVFRQACGKPSPNSSGVNSEFILCQAPAGKVNREPFSLSFRGSRRSRTPNPFFPCAAACHHAGRAVPAQVLH